MGENTRGRREGDSGLGNKLDKWKVYSRRRHKKIDAEMDNEGLGESRLQSMDREVCQGLEDHQLASCQSTDDSSSANFESDKEALDIIEVETDIEREKAEEAGFEGIRYLMESKVGESEREDNRGEKGKIAET